MKPEELKVVLDEDLPKLLEALGLREKLEDGEILCHQCGVPVTFSTIGLIRPTASGYLFFVQQAGLRAEGATLRGIAAALNFRCNKSFCVFRGSLTEEKDHAELSSYNDLRFSGSLYGCDGGPS